MTRSFSMEMESIYMKEQIIKISLKILYLLTGEDYGPIKKESSDAPPPSPTPERTFEKKVLRLISKMIELLSGEVPVRCQDVTVHFSMEEWEYMEGNKNAYKNLVTENKPPPTSLNASSNRIPAERYTGPLNSQDSSLKHTIPHDYQPEEINTVLTRTDQDMEEEKPNDLCKDIMMENQPALPSPDVSSSRNPPDRGRGPLYSQDYSTLDDHKGSPPEDHNSSNEYHQEEDLKIVFLEVDQVTDEGDVKIKEEEEPVEIGSGGGWFRPEASPDAEREDDPVTVDSPETHPVSPDFHPALHSTSPPSPYSTPNSRTASLPSRSKTNRPEGRFPCPDCGKSFNYRAKLLSHQITHTHEKPFSCEECGRRFAHKTSLMDHQKIHTGEKPFSCSYCGKSFIQKSKMTRHQRIHTGEKPYACSECGRCFAYRSNLIEHQRIHTGEMLYPCTDCGKCFTHKTKVIAHQKLHSGEKPYTCSDCGKCFSHKFNLLEHQKTHTGEKPFECVLCGRFFARKSNLVEHQKVHTGEKPFTCMDCGQRFAHRSTLVKHMSTHKVTAVPVENTGQQMEFGPQTISTETVVHQMQSGPQTVPMDKAFPLMPSGLQTLPVDKALQQSQSGLQMFPMGKSLQHMQSGLQMFPMEKALQQMQSGLQTFAIEKGPQKKQAGLQAFPDDKALQQMQSGQQTQQMQFKLQTETVQSNIIPVLESITSLVLIQAKGQPHPS